MKQLPPTRAGKYRRGPHPAHAKLHARLHKVPGEWVKVPTSGKSQANRLANAIRLGRYIAFRDAKYEAVMRGTDVFVRLVVE